MIYGCGLCFAMMLTPANVEWDVKPCFIGCLCRPTIPTQAVRVAEIYADIKCDEPAASGRAAHKCWTVTFRSAKEALRSRSETRL